MVHEKKVTWKKNFHDNLSPVKKVPGKALCSGMTGKFTEGSWTIFLFWSIYCSHSTTLHTCIPNCEKRLCGDFFLGILFSGNFFPVDFLSGDVFSESKKKWRGRKSWKKRPRKNKPREKMTEGNNVRGEKSRRKKFKKIKIWRVIFRQLLNFSWQFFFSTLTGFNL